ncbi:MAG TPA: hypothetical protein VKM54_06750, partial [Myxococcota bacterium]|nr:hypothetical protein [Myxococcota bacterium]
GILGLVLRARSEAQRGDSDRAFAALGRMADRGFDGFSGIQNDPGLEPLRTDPRFDALVAKLADNWIRIVTTRREKTLFQPDLETLAQAQLARGERQLAIETLHRALDAGGPFGDNIRLELNELEEKGNAAD